MRKYKVYLAGPITGLSYESACNWRKDFISLMPEEIVGMSPMRGKSYLAGKSEIEKEDASSIMSCARGIMTRDHFDCMDCDLLVVNFLGAKRVSIGTSMEIAWAYAYRKPVVCMMEEGNVHEHPMIDEAIGYRVKSIDQAAIITKSILLPVDH